MKKNYLLLSYLFVITLGISFGFASCKDDDDPAPEIVQDETAYYIVGEVLSDGKALEGVSVKTTTGVETTTDADGVFELKLSAKGSYKISFSKDGYVPVSAETTIKSNAKNRASMALKQELTKKAAAVRVTPNEEVEIVNEEAGVTLDIPAGALSEAVDITMTPFTPGAHDIAAGTVSASLISLNLEPDGLKFNEPVELKLTNPMGSDLAFGNMKHIIERNGVRTEAGDVEFDSEEKCYIVMLDGFSNHSFEISANATEGTATELLETIIIDNLGNVSAKNETVTVKQKFGWSTDGDIVSSLKSKYPNLPDATISALASSITNAVASLMGSAPGTGELKLTMPFNVSGDTKLTAEVVAQIETNVFSFPLIFAEGGLEWFTVSTKKYVGTEINTTYQYGNSHTEHSGGSGS